MVPAVLGFDTSGAWCSAALLRGNDVHARRARVGNAHSAHLLAMIDAVLAEASLPLDQCAAIAFSAGPGSFTGLRVACAAAQGLGFGASVPVAPIGTLDAIARSVPMRDDRDERSMLVAQDARMGELYWSTMVRRDDAVHEAAPPMLGSPERLREHVRSRYGDRPLDVGCGDAWSTHAAAMEGLVARVVPRPSADAVDVARLGRVALLEGRLVAAEFASPVYVRNDVALTTAERTARLRARSAAADLPVVASLP